MHKRALVGSLAAVMITGAVTSLPVASAAAATQNTVPVDGASLAAGASSSAGIYSVKETYPNTASTAIVPGPDGASGPGSLELRTEANRAGSQNDKIYVGKNLPGVAVGDFDKLAYTVRTSPTNDGQMAPYLQMSVHDDLTTFASLVFDPNDASSWSHGAAANGTWTTYDGTSADAMWRNTRVLNGVPTWTYKTLADWQAADPSLVTLASGSVMVVAGQTTADAHWSNYRAQLDQLAVGVKGDTTVYDFGGLGTCAVDTDAVTKTMTLTADCTTATTLQVPDGWTVDGNGHTVIATEANGSTFTGAVIQNAGTSMHVRDLTVTTTPDWANAGKNSGGNLAGIRFKNADGSLDDVTVTGISHGNGVQEGNAVDIDNYGGTTHRVVTAHDVTVSKYQKTGVRVNGNVEVTLSGADIDRAAGPDGAALDAVTAANSLQISRGADAVVTDSHIVGNDYDGDSSTNATAVLLYQAGDVTFERNVITGAGVDAGVDAYGTNGLLVARCNLVSRTPDNVGGLDVWHTGLLAESGAAITAIDNTIQGYDTPTDHVTNVVNQGSCKPTAPAITVDDIATTSATVNWTTAGSEYAPATDWEVSGPKGVESVHGTPTFALTGLEAGHAYTVSVRAINASGVGPWKTQAFTTKVVAVTTASLKSPAVTIYGGKVAVTGLLKVNGQPAGGRAVTLWRYDAGKWVAVGTTTTFSTGGWYVAFVPTKSAALQATSTGFPTATGKVTVASKVSVAAKGRTLTVSVRPKIGSSALVLQKWSARAWHTVAKGALISASSTATVKATSAGTYRVVVAAKSGYAAGTSASFRVA